MKVINIMNDRAGYSDASTLDPRSEDSRFGTLRIIEFSLAYSEPGSSVSIVSGYGLKDRAIEVRSPVEARGFFL
jgi:hypothetical protein